MKILKLLPACLLFLAACNNTAETKTDKPASDSASTAVVRPANNFYKKMTGKIGDNMLITMDLIKRRDSLNGTDDISGHYYYHKVGMPLTIRGSVNDSGIFELNEYNTKGDLTGTFKGSFINENEMKGNWIHPKTKKETSFELKTIETGDVNFVFSEYYNKNCKWADHNLKSTNKDTLNWFDTSCAAIHISLVTLQEKDKISKKMNEIIIRNTLSMSGGEKPEGSILQLLHSIDNYGSGEIMDADFFTGIVSNEGNILCLSVGSWMNTGGAHPNGYSFFLNFDKRTGDTISLLDVVKPETIDELVARSKQQFIKEYGALGENSDWFFGGEFIMPRTFSIGKGGLLFQYNPYEAGPYMMGAPEFFLPWSKIKDIVKPEYLK